MTYAQQLVLLPADTLWLAKDFRLNGGELHDEILAVTHHLSPPADSLLAMLRTGCDYRELKQAATRYALSTRQLMATLCDLQHIGALCLRRRRKDVIRGWMQWAWLLASGGHPLSAHHRNRATVIGLIRAVTYATLPIGVAAIPLYLAACSLFPVAICTVFAAGGYTLLVASIAVHEYGHLWVLRHYKTPVSIVYSRLRVRLHHRQISATRERIITVAGPVSGAAFCAVVTLGAFYLNSSVGITYGILLGGFHIYSLAPWQPDGMALQQGGRS